MLGTRKLCLEVIADAVIRLLALGPVEQDMLDMLTKCLDYDEEFLKKLAAIFAIIRE